MPILIFLLLMVFSSQQVMAELAVIVNPNNKLNSIERNVLQDIYLGRMRGFADGSMAIPIDQAKLRSEFYEKLTNRPIEQINAFWARIMFSGEASPPKIMPDDADVISIVKANPGAIGYVSKNSATDEVKILLILK